MGSRWIRLSLTWSESYWLVDLTSASRLSWVELLCYVKAFGTRGRAKRMRPDRAGFRWSIPPSDVAAMEKAAIKDGALVVDASDWVVTNWHSYQEPSTKRVQEHREREAVKGKKGNGTKRNATKRDETKGTLTLTLTETLTETEKEEREKRGRATELPNDWAPNDRHAEIASDEGVNLDRAAEMFRDHAGSNGRTQLRWDQAFNNWLRSPYNGKVKSKSQTTGERLGEEMDRAFERLGNQP